MIIKSSDVFGFQVLKKVLKKRGKNSQDRSNIVDKLFPCMTYAWNYPESFWKYAVPKGQPIFTAPNITTDACHACLYYSLPFRK